MDFQTFQRLSSLFETHHFQIYLVGGSVRDYFLFKSFKDMDIATDATLDDMKKFLSFHKTFENLQSGTFLFEQENVDVTRFRKEKNYRDFRHPQKIEFTKNIMEDASRRDFTINAMYLDAQQNLTDPYNGMEDLHQKVLRMIGDPFSRIEEDPLRILRAIRFCETYHLKMESSLKKAVIKQKVLLKKISYSKICEELKKFSVSPKEVRKMLRKYSMDDIIPIYYENTTRLIFDLHCDTITKLYETKESLVKNKFSIDLNKMQKGSYLGQIFAVFIHLKKEQNPYQYALNVIDFYHQIIKENSFFIEEALSYEDFERIRNKGKRIAVLSIEEGGILEGNLTRLEELYKRGVRMMTLTWNYPNCNGYPNIDANQKPINGFVVNRRDGLTDFGKQVIRKMNELGMIIDISHLSDKGVEDVLNLSDKPVIASHSSYRKIYPSARNLDMELLHLLKEKQGLIGVNYCPEFIACEKKNYLQSLKKHFSAILKDFDSSLLGFGSDFDGIDAHKSLKSAADMEKIISYLKKNVHGKKALEEIGFRNFLKVWKANQNS